MDPAALLSWVFVLAFKRFLGPVWVEGWEERDDITVLDIPSDCIGYVTGSRRAALGGMEAVEKGIVEVAEVLATWRGLIAFLGFFNLSPEGLQEMAAREVELKVMSSVEEKAPGQYTRGIREKFSDSKGFATDRMIFKDSGGGQEQVLAEFETSSRTD
ncbi:hypothetical protein AK812_SmicGene445 [Symbiodinium microadriaticum]|uniref:Uncharacterized protein n=1 Tax=Symbiodinium microadriaticum TaxID=2951 RepID=A0A1Q9F6R1_SYMMI|nr:hypothetical protein AK812_SmicGene445 [Symbiodinium microadriaticum]